MKKIYTLFIVTVFIAACATTRLKDGSYHLDIYATNDLHGRFFDSLYTEKGVNKYSLSQVYNYMSMVRDTSSVKPVLLDIGDHIQGDNATFFFNFVDTNNKHLFAQLIEFSGYDAVVVGNHDIETGHKVYDKLKRELHIPYLAANAIDTKTGKCYFEPYTIIKRDGIKIAVIGMTNPNISNWLSPELWSGIAFTDIMNPAQKWINYVIRKEKPQLVILATHTGIGESKGEYMPENSSMYAAANLQYLDAVFAAHDHQVFCKKIMGVKDSVILIEAGSRASALSKVSFNLTVKDGRITTKNISGSIIKLDNIGGSNSFNREFSSEFHKVKDFTNKKVGHLDTKLTSRDTYFGTSSYLNLIHQVQIKETGADISMSAPLTFDVNIQPGDINFQDLLTIYPFENQLYVMSLKGSEIKGYLEYSYSLWVNTMKNPGDNMLLIRAKENGGKYFFVNRTYNFDSAYGIIYTVDLTKENGYRINIISMADGTPFNMDKFYKVALSSYRASGGGDLLLKGAGLNSEERESRVIRKMQDVRELIYNFFVSGKKFDPEVKNWKFLPEEFLNVAKKREYQLIFPN